MQQEPLIIKEAQKGSLSAFNQLVMAYQGTAYNVAYRVIGNGDAAADACQDSFLKAYKSIKQYQGGSFKSWLLRIVTKPVTPICDMIIGAPPPRWTPARRSRKTTTPP
jgi:DNA-directed RNA polymerase specialized sigma24 family protein